MTLPPKSVTVGDQTYTVPNLSLCSMSMGKRKVKNSKGQAVAGTASISKHGFWIDCLTGPYAALGVDCEWDADFGCPKEEGKGKDNARDLFLVMSKGTGTEQFRHNCCQIAVYNVLSYLYETETGKKYRMRQEHEIYSGLGRQASVERRVLSAKASPTKPQLTGITS